MEWVNVKDRLPEKGQTVLAFGYRWESDILDKETFENGKIFLCSYSNEGHWYESGGTYYTTEVKDVTHWMPLPEVPK